MNTQIEQVRASGVGQFLKTHPVSFRALDGSDIVPWLEEQGYIVVAHRDNGRSGEAETSCGMVVHTNGYCHPRVKSKGQAR